MWAPELEANPLHKKSHERVCLGHMPVSGFESPSKVCVARARWWIDDADGWSWWEAEENGVPERAPPAASPFWGRPRLALAATACVQASKVEPIVLEVTDTAVQHTLSSSEYMAAVVEQLLPPPLRYRLAWHDAHAKPPLYIWRAVPPSHDFVAVSHALTNTCRDRMSVPSLSCRDLTHVHGCWCLCSWA